MNSLTVFNFESQEVRVVFVDEQPWFCLVDVCAILAITNASNPVSRLRGDGIHSMEVIDALGRIQKANFVNEQNLYRLIFQSRKTKAQKFQDWVFDSVLPSIRKTGRYEVTPTPQLPPSDLALKVARSIAEMNNLLSDEPRLLQCLKDAAMNEVMHLLPGNAIASAPRLKSVVEIALDMGYTQASNYSTRVRLGQYVARKLGGVATKEERLCNGTVQKVNCYPDTDEVRDAIALFFE